MFADIAKLIIFFVFRFLVSHFSKEQLERYEMFRRSKFPKNLIRKVNYFEKVNF